MSSFLASFSRWSLVALASTPPLVVLFVVRPPAACASDGPFLPFSLRAHRSPTFSKLCFTAAHATWLARLSSPYSSAAESWAFSNVRWAFFGERRSVLGSSDSLALPLFVVLGMTSPPGSWTGHYPGGRRGSHGEESSQLGGELTGGFLGHMVTAVDPPAAAQIGRPGRPDLPRVPVQLLQVVLGRPQHQRRTGDPASRLPVGLVRSPVDAESGPVVLEHGVHGVGVMDRRPVVGVVLFPHRRGLARLEGPVPGIGISADRPLRLVRLGEEEPVPPCGSEPGVGAVEVLHDGDGVEDG